MAVGEPDVDVLLARLTSRQITEWMAFYQIEPFGEERADLRMAVLAMLLANANRDPQKRREPFSVNDFMLHFGEARPEPDERQQTWQQQKAMMQALFKTRPVGSK